MKQQLSYMLIALLFAGSAGCSLNKGDNPYGGSLCGINVQLVYPEGYESSAHEGVAVRVEEVNFSYKYEAYTDELGLAGLALPSGLYRMSVSDLQDTAIFNGTTSTMQVTAVTDVALPLTYSKRGTLVIKEIYCGGCQKLPQEGTYQADKYVLIHNNDVQTAYLDSLCFCTLYPYNAVQNNPWGGIQDFAPIYMAVWQFGGNGTSFPIKSGEDAVLCLNGAIDHTVQYPLSVNLNKAAYFVCYNQVYFPNTTYHPAPGDKIQNDHIMECVVKLGQANAYSFSVNSPTALIFKTKGCTIQDYILRQDVIEQVPGSGVDKALKIPWDWVMDAVEVFTPSGSCHKRLPNDMDSGYVILTETGMGHTLLRKKDEEASQKAGYEVLCDTNNSSSDFSQSEKATLHTSNE